MDGYYGWGWTGFREIVMQWQQIGLFDVVLPLLLVFAVVYAILDKIKVLGENKGVNVVISLVLAFFAVSNLYISGFFMYLFQYTGVAIAIMLAIIVLLGLFANDNENRWKWIFGVGGFALLIWVLSRAASTYGISFLGENFSWWLSNNLYWLLPLVLIAGVIIVVVLSSKSKTGEKSALEKWFGKNKGN